MKKILSIDDNPTDILINSVFLKRTFPDHEIILFSRPDQAMEFILNNADDLPETILVDINMPVVSGWDIVQQLSEINAGVNVFMLTSSVFNEDLEYSKRFPIIKEFFIKPLSSTIIETLSEHVSAASVVLS